MKGYKVFCPDWTCRGKQYAVGKIATQDGELELCENGIHFCTILADCFCYYNADPDNKLAEVEALGDILQEDRDSKCCTNKLKVIRELSIAELLKDKAFCLEVVKRNPRQVWFMKGMKPEFYLTVMQETGLLLVHVPENMKFPELCLAAVQYSSLALRDVPEAMKTPDICMAAVQKCGLALEYVPEHLKTPEIYLAAVKQNGWMLEDVPDAMKTPDLCLAAVKQKGWALNYVPEHLKTAELCLAAVRQNGLALQYVIEQTPEICKAAVLQNPDAIYHVRNGKLKAHLMNMEN